MVDASRLAFVGFYQYFWTILWQEFANYEIAIEAMSERQEGQQEQQECSVTVLLSD